jgi:hypothetical protein
MSMTGNSVVGAPVLPVGRSVESVAPTPSAITRGKSEASRMSSARARRSSSSTVVHDMPAIGGDAVTTGGEREREGEGLPGREGAVDPEGNRATPLWT